MEILHESLRGLGFQLLCFAAPVLMLVLLLHFFDTIVQYLLLRRFGWRGLLWTAWIGTPIHELSHAALCLLFGRRILELVLFRPDPKEMRLGYVRYTYRPGSLLDQVGNCLIGVAPLIGGAAVLYGLLWLFFPAAGQASLDSAAISQAVGRGDFPPAIRGFTELVAGVFGKIITPDNLADWRLWVFGYLVLCIGAHMAPSKVDYAGGRWGAVILAVLLSIGLVGMNLVVQAAGGSAGDIAAAAAPIFAPLIVVFALAAALTGAAVACVAIVVTMLDWVLGR